jgi:hypothetical protein
MYDETVANEIYLNFKHIDNTHRDIEYGFETGEIKLN